MIEITGLDEIFESLDKLALKGVRLTPVLRQIGQYIQNDTEDSFENQRSPFGGGWIPNKNPRAGKQILIDSGTLKGSFTVDADENSVSVGTNVVYAAIHQFGGRAGRDKRVNIPARPFMPVDDYANMPKDLVDMIMEELAEKLLEK